MQMTKAPIRSMKEALFYLPITTDKLFENGQQLSVFLFTYRLLCDIIKKLYK
jgi:hypothetical protein